MSSLTQLNGYAVENNGKNPPIIDFLKLVVKSASIPILYYTSYVRMGSNNFNTDTLLYTKKYNISNYDELVHDTSGFEGMGAPRHNDPRIKHLKNEYNNKVRFPMLLNIFPFPIVEELVNYELYNTRTLHTDVFDKKTEWILILNDDVNIEKTGTSTKCTKLKIDKVTKERYVILKGGLEHLNFMISIYDMFNIVYKNLTLKLRASSFFNVKKKDSCGFTTYKFHNIMIYPVDNIKYIDLKDNMFVLDDVLHKNLYERDKNLTKCFNMLLQSGRIRLQK